MKLKKLIFLKNAEMSVQELTDSYIKKIDEMYAKKEIDIMKV